MKFLRNSVYIVGLIGIILLCAYSAEVIGIFHYEENGHLHLYDLFHTYLPDLHRH